VDADEETASLLRACAWRVTRSYSEFRIRRTSGGTASSVSIASALLSAITSSPVEALHRPVRLAAPGRAALPLVRQQGPKRAKRKPGRGGQGCCRAAHCLSREGAWPIVSF